MVLGELDERGQITLGEALKHNGMEHAEVAADEWKRTWEQAIHLLAAIGDPFTSDDVRAIAGEPWNHPNACGSLFHKASRAGVIRVIGYRKSERARLRRHPLTVWEGVPQ